MQHTRVLGSSFRCLDKEDKRPQMPPTGGLEKLSRLCLDDTQVSDAGCATLTAALNSGALPALEMLYFRSTRDLGRILAIGRDVARAPP